MRDDAQLGNEPSADYLKHVDMIDNIERFYNHHLKHSIPARKD